MNTASNKRWVGIGLLGLFCVELALQYMLQSSYPPAATSWLGVTGPIAQLGIAGALAFYGLSLKEMPLGIQLVMTGAAINASAHFLFGGVVDYLPFLFSLKTNGADIIIWLGVYLSVLLLLKTKKQTG